MAQNPKTTRDYKNGAKDAEQIVESHGLKWARMFCDSKLSYRDKYTPTPIVNYWQGYSDKLDELKTNNLIKK